MHWPRLSPEARKLFAPLLTSCAVLLGGLTADTRTKMHGLLQGTPDEKPGSTSAHPLPIGMLTTVGEGASLFNCYIQLRNGSIICLKRDSSGSASLEIDGGVFVLCSQSVPIYGHVHPQRDITSFGKKGEHLSLGAAKYSLTVTLNPETLEVAVDMLKGLLKQNPTLTTFTLAVPFEPSSPTAKVFAAIGGPRAWVMLRKEQPHHHDFSR